MGHTRGQRHAARSPWARAVLECWRRTLRVCVCVEEGSGTLGDHSDTLRRGVVAVCVVGWRSSAVPVLGNRVPAVRDGPVVSAHRAQSVPLCRCSWNGQERGACASGARWLPLPMRWTGAPARCVSVLQSRHAGSHVPQGGGAWELRSGRLPAVLTRAGGASGPRSHATLLWADGRRTA